jgi:hypothetical protein
MVETKRCGSGKSSARDFDPVPLLRARVAQRLAAFANDN